MNWLLDTSIVIALARDTRDVVAPAMQMLVDSRAVVSAVSLWEISIKVSISKLDMDVDRVLGFLEQRSFEQLDVTWKHARAVRDLPLHHRDPFDRLLIAQAVVEPLNFMTTDRSLARYSPLVHVI